MNSPAHDIALYLQSLSFGTLAASSGWAIAVAREPVAPDTTITVYDTGGQGPDTDELDEFLPDIQVRVRAPDYIAAYAKSEGIRAALTLTQPIYALTSDFTLIVMTQEIASLGRDDNDRHILVASYSCRRVDADDPT